jgi:hypothetical protein
MAVNLSENPAEANPRGKRVLATLLRGGKIKGRTEDWGG